MKDPRDTEITPEIQAALDALRAEPTTPQRKYQKRPVPVLFASDADRIEAALDRIAGALTSIAVNVAAINQRDAMRRGHR
jgi:hypothetical protein